MYGSNCIQRHYQHDVGIQHPTELLSGLVLRQSGPKALLCVVKVISSSWLAQRVNHVVLVAAW